MKKKLQKGAFNMKMLFAALAFANLVASPVFAAPRYFSPYDCPQYDSSGAPVPFYCE
jgi:hypothetical protein